MSQYKHTQKLRLLLYAGAAYFLGVAVVHSLGIKIPGLFVYFNVPSYTTCTSKEEEVECSFDV